MTVRNRFFSGNVLRHIITAASLMLCIFVMTPDRVSAEEIYINPQTGYRAVIEDEAALFGSGDMYYSQMTEKMEELTQYGDVALLSSSYAGGSARSQAQNKRESLFGGNSSTVFLIDMGNREIYIYSYGKMLRTISPAKALIITDNIYRYATLGDYTECAFRAFEQEAVLLEGGRISEPMKYICSLLLAFLFAGIIVYNRARKISAGSMVNVTELLTHTDYTLGLADMRVTNISKTRVSNSSSSGGGGRSGGGGGGHSGGGGGHHF